MATSSMTVSSLAAPSQPESGKITGADVATKLRDSHAEAVHDRNSFPPEPPVTVWLNILFRPIQALSIFGGSITFTLIVSSNAPPTKRFTDQTVRDLLSMAWLFFALALAISKIAELINQAFNEKMQKFMAAFLPLCLGGCIFGSFLLLSVVVLAYSDVGWAEIALLILGGFLCLTGWSAFTIFEKHLDGLLGLRPLFRSSE
jgi:hypothetical protein